MPADDSVVFHNVSFRFDTASQTLFDDLSVHFSRGFTGVVGANGSGKTTLLRLATGELEPSQGSVQGPFDALYCPRRTDDPPLDLAPLLEASDPAPEQTPGWDRCARLARVGGTCAPRQQVVPGWWRARNRSLPRRPGPQPRPAIRSARRSRRTTTARSDAALGSRSRASRKLASPRGHGHVPRSRVLPLLETGAAIDRASASGSCQPRTGAAPKA